MTAKTIDESLRREFDAIAQSEGCEILDARFQAGVLKLVLDHPDGVGLGHCERVSKQVSALLDVSDFGPGRYTLEVSSPGLDRPLYGDRDWERFVGERVRVTWRQDGAKRTASGRLAAFDTARRRAELAENPDLPTIPLDLDDVEMARLDPEL